MNFHYYGYFILQEYKIAQSDIIYISRVNYYHKVYLCLQCFLVLLFSQFSMQCYHIPCIVLYILLIFCLERVYLIFPSATNLIFRPFTFNPPPTPGFTAPPSSKGQKLCIHSSSHVWILSIGGVASGRLCDYPGFPCRYHISQISKISQMDFDALLDLESP